MPSLQNPSSTAKSAKFVAADPLGPMVDPFPSQELNDDPQSLQKILADNVNARMEKAMKELQEKHRQGTNEMDDPNRAPTGEPYRRRQQQQQQQQLQQQQFQQQTSSAAAAVLEHPWIRPKTSSDYHEPNDDDDDDDDNSLLDDDDDDNNDDPVLEAIRQRRLEEMKRAHQLHLQHLALGHGEVRTIVQDEFLPECTGSSEWVAIHFFHATFATCHIMDAHLQRIAPLHTTCKFLRIEAEKAPFFVQKLHIQTLPTLLVFRHGQLVSRLIGFQGLVADDQDDTTTTTTTTTFPTSRLQEWLASTGAIDYSHHLSSKILDDQQQQQRGNAQGGSIRRGGLQEYDG